ncbi:VOC family protein [Dongshaea marina]|uniref:VOC family protein n=1 Tax=Dongshaea marina TaxID=2047966 RepID=UPI000D3E3034|nr:VOC family protein [Dongshaea marina]
MRIDHIGLWVNNLEMMREFYQTWFAAKAGPLYHNPDKGFRSYFLSFETQSGDHCRLELMSLESTMTSNHSEKLGWAHIAFSLGSRQRVDSLSDELARAGYRLLDGPRTTGDGYYEAKIEDPEGNIIELTR